MACCRRGASSPGAAAGRPVQERLVEQASTLPCLLSAERPAHKEVAKSPETKAASPLPELPSFDCAPEESPSRPLSSASPPCLANTATGDYSVVQVESGDAAAASELNRDRMLPAWFAEVLASMSCAQCRHVHDQDESVETSGAHVAEHAIDVMIESPVHEAKEVVVPTERRPVVDGDVAADESQEVPEVANSLQPGSPSPRRAGSPHFGSDVDGSDEAQQQPCSCDAVVSQEPGSAPRPDFSGHWKLAYTVGDMDAFMADMGAGWVLRKLGKALGYGVGRVSITMEQWGDTFTVGKVMADPTRKNAYMELEVGKGWTDWSDEFGPCRVFTTWEGSNVLHWDVRLVPSGSASQMNMYYVKGELVEEYIGPSGVTIQYFFQKV
eukprot:TRINITY_DN11812_c0_g2_i1.p1 TRINITY_DN11812_c0_g2~~TRINITY_DN11812_c0_g2_i1.p1  ORF type:complete len:405 (+),score=87.84 TRINITY_DN11812_c0_g2_i1:71-1216(+)